MERYVTSRKWLFFPSVPRIVPLCQASTESGDFLGICLIFTIFRVDVTLCFIVILMLDKAESIVSLKIRPLSILAENGLKMKAQTH